MNKHLYVLGDIHGEFGQIKQSLLKLNKNHWPGDSFSLIQLGDMGIGFPPMEKHHGIWLSIKGEPRDPKDFPNNFHFIRGNHDNLKYCNKYPNYLGDYGFNNDLGIFYVSGAASHDKALRKENIDWWADEELSNQQFYDCLDLYSKIKPNIVISHEPPVVAHAAIRKGLEVNSSKTSQALQSMWEIHKPNYWYFGHHHLILNKNIQGTNFVCVAINQVVKVKR
jgi:predicted phosphodiesterase